jgi:hypothetical protein
VPNLLIFRYVMHLLWWCRRRRLLRRLSWWRWGRLLRWKPEGRL